MSNHIPTTAEVPSSAVEIAVAESTGRKAATKKTRKPAAKSKVKMPAKPKPKAARAADTAMPPARASENLCVFALRMTPEERDEIHEAAGPARASRFVRAVALAAARGDLKAVQSILLEAQGEAGC
jgi:hypothetical protein